MRRFFLMIAVVGAGLALGALSEAPAQQQNPVDETRFSLGNQPFDTYTGGRAIQGSNRPRPRQVPTVTIPQPVVPGPVFPTYPVYPRYQVVYPPAYGYGYGYPAYGYPYPPVYYGPRYYPGPVFVPAETLYGPAAVQRFMGAR